MIPEAALQDIRVRNPVPETAAKWVSLRAGGKGRMVGPCPICSTDPHSRDAARFECWPDKWVCAVCAAGGDVIKLVQLKEGRDFLGAVEWLGGTQAIDPAEAMERERALAAKKAEQERRSAYYRENERRQLWRLWNDASRLPGSIAADYLTRRGIVAPAGACLRAHRDIGYFATGGTAKAPLHRGPAMLAAILGPNGVFAGLHMTWIDLDAPKGKLALADGEGTLYPAKKVRGTMAGGRIELLRHKAPRRLFLGEGIETVLVVQNALARLGRDLSDAAFWSGVSLGNIGGKALETVQHPTLRDAAGRARRVSGPVPDLTSPAIMIPDSVTELVLLGDSDSDGFLTETTLARAVARFSRPGRRVRIAWPPEGRDFDDMTSEAAHG